MKKIKNMNGYAIYQAGARDVKKYGYTDGDFYVYFASDVRDFGLPNSTPEFEDCGSLREAEANCTGNFAIAKEIVEERTTAASMDEILEVEAMLDAGADPESLDSEALEPERIRSRCDNTTLTRIVDRWNPRKVWLIKRYADGHFALNQEVGGRVLYSRFVRASKQRINEIFACCTAEGENDPKATAHDDAKAAGIPFSSRLSAGAGDELDPYVYDGSMTPEDYELMHEQMAAESMELTLTIGPEQAATIAETVRRAFDRALETVRKAADWLVEALRKAATAIRESCQLRGLHAIPCKRPPKMVAFIQARQEGANPEEIPAAAYDATQHKAGRCHLGGDNVSKPFNTCPKCGSNLDHGETCDCENLKETASEAGQEAAQEVVKQAPRKPDEPMFMYGA